MHPDATLSAQGSTAPVTVPTLYVALNSAAVVGRSLPRPGRAKPRGCGRCRPAHWTAR
jgi:hypothetical protein